MGTLCSDPCPTHPHLPLTQICLCESCLEPLCEECVLIHNKIHSKLGYPSSLSPYTSITKQYKKVSKPIVKPREAEVAAQLLPTSIIVKELTKEYFNHRNDSADPPKVLKNLEVWKTMRDDPEVNRKITEFFKRKLIANKEVVGKDFVGLY